uniref:Uncharacterized protein n=1 Tax=Zea mays TaxID=4577 RepID=A0A804REW7_MAIZE
MGGGAWGWGGADCALPALSSPAGGRLVCSGPRSVADASSSSSGVDRARRLHAPLRDDAGDRSSAVKVAMADDDDVNPVTGNDDLHAAGLVPD